MSSSHYKLFIDETGHPHQNHKSTHFTLVGVIIEDKNQTELKIKADQLRFKYWDKTNIVFHSEEIGHKIGDFKQFADDKALGIRFEKQFLGFLNSCPIYIIAAVIDKAKAYKTGWNVETILAKASEALVLDYMSFLYGQNAQGRIVYESSGATRDKIYLASFHQYLDPRSTHCADFVDVRKKLTSITFANKLNHDTEMQIADIFSYAAISKFQQSLGKKFDKKSYEQKIITIFENKLLSMPSGTSKPEKKEYYSRIKGLSILPIDKPKKKAKNKEKTA
jgi:hypothetical protein